MEANDVFYSAWQPVRVNAGEPEAGWGFYINDKGLQSTSSLVEPPGFSGNSFGGWLVCDWWHGSPQLFFRINYYDDPAPCSCAEVWLCPEYI